MSRQSQNSPPGTSKFLRAFIFTGLFITEILIPRTIFSASFQNAADSLSANQPLFDSEEPIEFTLISDFKKLTREKELEEPQYQPAELLLEQGEGNDKNLSIKIKARGFSRRKYDFCAFPPLHLNFNKKSVAGTVFEGQDKLKLVTYCKNSDVNQEYVLEEYLIYKMYNLLTKYSFRVRLVNITYQDISENQKLITRYGFFIESDKNLAARLNAMISKEKLPMHDRCDHSAIDLFTIFQYMIGNTDWWVSTFHNVTVLQVPSKLPVPVPYDFDFSGAINTPYAVPAEGLSIKSVRERIFRGYCRPAGVYEKTIPLFLDKKEAIYELYNNFSLLDAKDREATLKYYDSFYEILSDPKKIIRTFYDHCEIHHKHLHQQ